MKIKNIFFAAILVLAGFSCSMEDDAIMNDVEKGIEEATEAYTVLDFGVVFKDMATKALTTVIPGEDRPATGNENKEEKKISEVSVFLLEDGKVIGILTPKNMNQVSPNSDGSITLKDLKFVTKYKTNRTLDAHVVINGNQFLKNINIGDAQSALNQQISGCLSADQLIKYGSTSIVFGKDITNSYPSPSVAENNPTTILVKVSHVAARLDFSQFDVILSEEFTNRPTVTLSEAKFVNIQDNGTICGTSSNINATGEVVASIPEGVDNRWSHIVTTYSYANTITALYVKFTVDGRIFEKTYPINPDNINKEVNHNGIKGGYLYDIKVRWTITPKWGDSTIEFYTKDWVHNTIPEVVL